MAEKPAREDVEKLAKAALARMGHPKEEERRRENIPEQDIKEIVRNVRVRLAGWRDGRRVDAQEEIDRFQCLELPTVRWRHNFDEASKRTDLPLDDHNLNEIHTECTHQFREKGGHISVMPGHKIEYIMRNGVIAFLELEVREGLFVTLGSVSALSSTPWTDYDPSLPPPRDTRGLHALWPNYDIRDVGMPEEQKLEWASQREKRLLIVRSTILDQLEEQHVQLDLQGESLPEHLQGRELRRLGLAARGKFEVFMIALARGSKSATFNIGTISESRGTRLRLDLGNKPSQEHNKWAEPIAWRTQYYDRLLPTPVSMYWKAYDGEIVDGLEMIQGPDGIFDRKGYSLALAQQSAKYNGMLIDCDIQEGRHEPWQQKEMSVE